MSDSIETQPPQQKASDSEMQALPETTDLNAPPHALQQTEPHTATPQTVSNGTSSNPPSTNTTETKVEPTAEGESTAAPQATTEAETAETEPVQTQKKRRRLPAPPSSPKASKRRRSASTPSKADQAEEVGADVASDSAAAATTLATASPKPKRRSSSSGESTRSNPKSRKANSSAATPPKQPTVTERSTTRSSARANKTSRLTANQSQDTVVEARENGSTESTPASLQSWVTDIERKYAPVRIELEPKSATSFEAVTSLGIHGFAGATADVSGFFDLLQLDRFTNVTTLDISNNGFVALPAQFYTQTSSLRQLSRLNLNDNKLTTLSDQLGTLQCLERLSLSNNEFTEVPEALGLLHATLQTLELGSNKIQAVPSALLRRLTKLKVIDLAGCPVHDTLVNVCSANDITELEKSLLTSSASLQHEASQSAVPANSAALSTNTALLDVVRELLTRDSRTIDVSQLSAMAVWRITVELQLPKQRTSRRLRVAVPGNALVAELCKEIEKSLEDKYVVVKLYGEDQAELNPNKAVCEMLRGEREIVTATLSLRQ